jgi:hypothetical protein
MCQLGCKLVDAPTDGLRWFAFLCLPGSFGRQADCIQPRWAPASVATRSIIERGQSRMSDAPIGPGAPRSGLGPAAEPVQ